MDKKFWGELKEGKEFLAHIVNAGTGLATKKKHM